MKKIIFAFLLIIVIKYGNSQTSTFGDVRTYKFFKTYDDYVQNKPIEGVVLIEMSTYGSTIEIENNGKREKYKENKIPYTWFCNSHGMLMRVFDGSIYYVIVAGPMFHYTKCKETWAGYTFNTSTNQMRTEYSFLPSGDGIFKNYYSNGSDGTIEVFKDSMFDELLNKYDLKNQFNQEKPKREAKDSVLDYKNKEWRREIRFKILFNEKMK